jgi:hypothetical protein
MEFVCPECLGSLLTQDGQTAHCTTHGGQYRILFSRWQPPPPPVMTGALGALEYQLVPGAVCVQHPQVPAAHVCRDCGTALCVTCAFAQADGSQLCPNCALRAPAAAVPPRLNAVGEGLPVPVAVPLGAHCVQHSNLPATAQCKSCGAFMCATCDFVVAGGLHLCPACATSPRTTLSPRRKGLLIGSFAAALWCSVLMVALMAGAFASFAGTKEGEQMMGVILTLILLAPSIVGLSLGLSAMDRRLFNPPVVWIAIIWNAIVLGGFVLLCAVGILMGN